MLYQLEEKLISSWLIKDSPLYIGFKCILLRQPTHWDTIPFDRSFSCTIGYKTYSVCKYFFILEHHSYSKRWWSIRDVNENSGVKNHRPDGAFIILSMGNIPLALKHNEKKHLRTQYVPIAYATSIL